MHLGSQRLSGVSVDMAKVNKSVTAAPVLRSGLKIKTSKKKKTDRPPLGRSRAGQWGARDVH